MNAVTTLRVVAINTSPEKEQGQLSALLDPFLDGLRDSGAEVELYYSRDLLIFPCCGNMNCTVGTPGQCMAWDDMKWLRPKIGRADVLVLASPLYYNGLTGPAGATGSLQLLRERLDSVRQFDPEVPYEHAVHTRREVAHLRKVILVSGCGFWEIRDFYPVLTHLKAFCYNTFPELPGCIYGPKETAVLGELPENISGGEAAEIAREAGRRLTRDPAPASALPDACEMPAEAPERTAREWYPVVLYPY